MNYIKFITFPDHCTHFLQAFDDGDKLGVSSYFKINMTSFGFTTITKENEVRLNDALNARSLIINSIINTWNILLFEV